MSGRGGEAAASFGPPPAPPLRSTAAGVRAHAPPAALTHPGGTAAPGRGDNFNPPSGYIHPSSCQGCGSPGKEVRGKRGCIWGTIGIMLLGFIRPPPITHRFGSHCCATPQGAHGPAVRALSSSFHPQGSYCCQTCQFHSS